MADRTGSADYHDEPNETDLVEGALSSALVDANVQVSTQQWSALCRSFARYVRRHGGAPFVKR